MGIKGKNVARLTQADVLRLSTNPTPAQRASTMLAVADVYKTGELSAEEREIAHAIINAVLPEAELEYRRLLAISLKNTSSLDRTIALQLANDVMDVARPVLAECLALTDQDLVAIIEQRSIEHARSIATRLQLPTSVSTALIETNDEIVVLRVAANENAAISAQAYHHMLDRFAENSAVTDAVAQRRVLPIAIAERMTTIVTGRILERLITRYNLKPARVSALIDHGRENILLTSFAPGQRAEEMRLLIDALHKNGLLSSTLILRAFCLGNFAFVLPALAVRAGIQVSHVRTLLNDEGDRGPRQLFEHGRLDLAYYNLFQKLTLLSRSERVRRFGYAPEGWRHTVRPILDEMIGDTNSEQAFEQRITEALLMVGNRTLAQSDQEKASAARLALA